MRYSYDHRSGLYSFSSADLKEHARRVGMTKEQCTEEDDRENARRIEVAKQRALAPTVN